MNRRTVRRITLWSIAGLVILGCASPFFVTPPPSVPTLAGIETVIVKTAAVAQTQTAALAPTSTRTPTGTPLPTKTATVTPTATATILFIRPTTTSVSAEDYDEVYGDNNGGGTNSEGRDSEFVKTPVVRDWYCSITSRYPRRGTVITRGSTFKATWTVKNTGTKTWPKQGVDVAFHAGADLTDARPYFDIPKTVVPGELITITITLTAPKQPGEYSTQWALRVGKRDFCLLRIAFEAK